MDIRDQLIKFGFTYKNMEKPVENMRDRNVLMNQVNHTMEIREGKAEVDLEDALDLAGAGKYQVFHGALMLASLIAALLGTISLSYILPAAACDLDIPYGLKGILTSIPNIGIIVTAPFWGKAADTYGRKPVLLISCTAGGIFGTLAALMPELISFALCMFAMSLFLSAPSSLCFAYASELVPGHYRDKIVLLLNSLLMLLSTLCPLLAWAVLSNDWYYELGALVLRPWRLLTAVYALPFFVTALWLITAEESPKFLMTKGKDKEALDVLRRVYAVNTSKSADSFGVKSLSLASENNVSENDKSAISLLRPPHLKWTALIGFLMFSLFALLNGLFLFAPDTINRAMNGDAADAGTVCTVINQIETNVTSSEETCTATMSNEMFYILVSTTLVYGLVVIAGSMSPLSKKTLLITMYTVVGVACMMTLLVPNRILAGASMSALQLAALGIGPLTAYVVHLFPTSLRGTAVGAALMFGRMGSVTGANAAGFFLPIACTPTFYAFTFLVFLCAGLSFMLPDSNR